MSICVTEVVGIVEQEHAQAAGISLAPSLDDEVVRRRDYLAGIYESLPGYGSDAFWRIVAEPDQRLALPLEALVKCVRAARCHCGLSRSQCGQTRGAWSGRSSGTVCGGRAV